MKVKKKKEKRRKGKRKDNQRLIDAPVFNTDGRIVRGVLTLVISNKLGPFLQEPGVIQGKVSLR